MWRPSRVRLSARSSRRASTQPSVETVDSTLRRSSARRVGAAPPGAPGVASQSAPKAAPPSAPMSSQQRRSALASGAACSRSVSDPDSWRESEVGSSDSRVILWAKYDVHETTECARAGPRSADVADVDAGKRQRSKTARAEPASARTAGDFAAPSVRRARHAFRLSRRW